jgi:8-oxo-dGTP pyrophosphatase MutT (NUDIX family)
LRELKEETGYTGTLNTQYNNSPVVYGDPWKSNENGIVVYLDVDGDLPVNQNIQ